MVQEGSSMRKSEVDTEALLSAYQSGKTIKDIAKEFSISPSTVNRIVRREGCVKNPSRAFDIKRLEQLYIGENLTAEQTAEAMGVSVDTIYMNLTVAGIKKSKDKIRETYNATMENRYGETFKSVMTESFLREMYVEHNKSAAKIAEELGCSVPLVKKYLKLYGIKKK